MPKPPAIEKASKPMLGDPPQPAAPKATGQTNLRGPVTKAEHAALKRIDKMVIKRMRKR